MGQINSTHSERTDRKNIEFEIFDKSFILIEKYVKKNTKGLSNRFRGEYAFAKSNRNNGYLNWHKVMAKQLTTGNGLGYVGAIEATGQLLKKAKGCSNGSDKQKFEEIYDLMDRLIELRTDDLKPNLSICCLVLWGGEQYDKHEVVLDAWKLFRH